MHTRLIQKNTDNSFSGRKGWRGLAVAMLAAGFLVGCSDTMTTQAAKMNEDELEAAINNRLDADPALKDVDADANSDADEVTLSGDVMLEADRSRALQVAHDVNSSLRVTDKIDVKPPEVARTDYTEDMATQERSKAESMGDKIGNSLDDAWIHTKITTKLVTDGDTPAHSINVDVMNNVVTLRGTVDTLEAKQEAERLAQETDGVKRVVNQLVVKNA